jgi:hypothetical protein
MVSAFESGSGTGRVKMKKREESVAKLQCKKRVTSDGGDILFVVVLLDSKEFDFVCSVSVFFFFPQLHFIKDLLLSIYRDLVFVSVRILKLKVAHCYCSPPNFTSGFGSQTVTCFFNIVSGHLNVIAQSLFKI